MMLPRVGRHPHTEIESIDILLQASAHLLAGLKILGGAALLWMAYKCGRSALKPVRQTPQVVEQGVWFKRGLLLNLSNPKAVIAWMAALSMGLGTGDGHMQVVAATLGCMALGVLNYTGYAVAFSLTGVMAAYMRLRRWIDGILAGLFAVAGLGLLRSAFCR
ncbi:LysE family translocator [Lichenicoccus sp.]|uniref:LysE family translocator n=1 Tax=Lichenicoccus sp. TaxID=2781899 RepID=UPI003D10F958